MLLDFGRLIMKLNSYLDVLSESVSCVRLVSKPSGYEDEYDLLYSGSMASVPGICLDFEVFGIVSILNAADGGKVVDILVYG